MTVVVGVETMKGTVILGADSCASTDSQVGSYAQEKVFRVHDYVLGFAGSWRVGQILRYSFDPPSLIGLNLTDEGLMKMMVNRFIPEWQEALEDGNVKSKDSWDILVGVKGRLFSVEGDFHVGRDLDGYQAIGGGAPFATGSLHSTQGQTHDRVRRALQAAEHHSPTVKGPFVTVEA